MDILLDKDYVKVIYEAEHNLITVEWTGKDFTSEQYKEIFNISIEYAKTNTVNYFLSDIRSQKVVSPTDRKWFEEEAMPNAIATGLKRGAILLGTNPFKRYYFNNIMAKSGKFKLPFKAFKTKEEAIVWFKS